MKFIHVNMRTHEIREDSFDQKDYGFLGGRGLVSKLLTDLCPPECDPLGPENPLVMTTGYFSGTILTTSNRFSVGAKSPLTGGIKESNSGGSMAKALTEQGIKVLVFEDQPAEDDGWYLLHVDADGNVSLEDASFIVGKNNYELGAMLRERYGQNISIASIGQAGENKALVGSIMITEFKTNNPCRAAARGGMGAVMGSKHLKAVVVDRAAKPYKVPMTPEQDKEFRELNKVCVAAIMANPLTGTTMPKYGSAAGVDVTGKMGALPWNNFSGKFCPEWNNLDSEHWYATMTEQGGRGGIPCQAGCIVHCSNEFCDKDGKYLSAGIEYETVALCGSNIGCCDPNVVAQLDRLCDDYGLDTIDIGCALGVMMSNHVLEFGDAEGAIRMVRTMFAPDNDWGKTLMNGAAAVADRLGEKSRVPVSKRQAFAAYDPRVIRGYGLSWERGPMGADHTAGSAFTFRKDLTPEQQADGGMGQACVCDCFMCLFPWSAVYYNPNARAAICRMAGILAGMEQGPGPELVDQLGAEILNREYAWNEKAGITHKKNDHFYGGKRNYMYQVAAEATGAAFQSLTFTAEEIAETAEQIAKEMEAL